MRKLAVFSACFAIGTLPVLLGAAYLILPVTALLAAVGIIYAYRFPGRRALLLWLVAGLLLGFLRAEATELYRVKTLSGSCGDGSFAIELTAYPEATEYGFSGRGELALDGRAITVSLYAKGSPEGLAPGSVLVGQGSLSRQTGENSSYYLSEGLPLHLYLPEWAVYPAANTAALRYWPVRLARTLREHIFAYLSEDTAPILTALLLGDRSGLSYLTKAQLKSAGIYHALAVSGMHVSVLMGAISLLCLRRRRLYPVLGVPVLVLYCFLTGLPASVIRASIMQLFLMAAPAFGRQNDHPTAMLTALFVLVLENPWSMLSAGLQISFLSTAGILFLNYCREAERERASSRREKSPLYKRMGAYIRDNISVSLAAMLFSAPALLLHFGYLPVYSILTNLLVIKLISFSFTLGLLFSVLSFFSTWASALLACVLQLLLRLAMLVIRFVAQLPYAEYYPEGLASIAAFLLLWLALCYLLFGSRRHNRKRLLLVVFVAVAAAVLCIVFSVSGRAGFVFTALDVGQGQCVLLESGGMTLAVDCGGSRGDTAGNELSSRLRRSGYAGLDFLLLTHYDTDHTDGVPQLLQTMRVSYLLLPDVPDTTGNRALVERTAADTGTQIYYIRRDLHLELGQCDVYITAPLAEGDSNAGCLTVRTDYQGYNVLITGDLGIDQERLLCERYDLRSTELLVAGHHGSAGSTSYTLLQETSPETVVISVGTNYYGHPHQAALDRITASGAELLRTDEIGTITIRR